MISKEKIGKTVICYWSAADESFIAESSLIPHVVLGVGETPEEAKDDFMQTLDGMFDEITSDNVAGYKMGRPAKGYAAFNINIRPSSKVRVGDLAKELEISQGEAVDYLVFFHECKLLEGARAPQRDEIAAKLDGVLKNMADGFQWVANKIDKGFRSSDRPKQIDIESMISKIQPQPVNLNQSQTVNVFIFDANVMASLSPLQTTKRCDGAIGVMSTSIVPTGIISPLREGMAMA